MLSKADKIEEIGKKHRVLVVDDDEKVRNTIFHVLKSEFDVTMAESGNKAIEILSQGTDFDVISLDLQMPGMSGIETLKVVKQLSPYTEAFIVSAKSDFEAAKSALKFGAYDYINKPFGNNELRQVVRAGIDRRLSVLGAEKVRVQLEFVKAQLIQSEKFSEIGTLIAGITHELKGPLTSILGFSEIPLITNCSPEHMRSYLEKINKSALLCNNIINRLLTFSRKREYNRECLHINSILTSTLELKEHDLRIDGIKVVTELSDKLPMTIADFYGLQQVFLNLINNAHQAMREQESDRILTIKSECKKKSICVSLCDTGPGIAQDNLQKIFEPLFTTKDKSEGTGLGLSICYEIVVNEHKGDLFVASEYGEGACFIVEIPVIKRGWNK